jgi:hypothetical protein
MLEFALAGVSILRALQRVDQKITYGQFARMIGLLDADDPWKIVHRDQVSDVLNLIAAIDRLTDDVTDFTRLVNERTGETGEGVNHESRIVVS